MKIICIGNYPPRQCGIATFTENVVLALQKAGLEQSIQLEIEVIAMNDSGQEYAYPSIVTRTIHDQNKSEYIDAAEYINNSNADVCLLEHEYGIFGGNSGVLLIALVSKLTIPIITTFHSVLQKPNFHQFEVLKKIAAYSHGIIVMSQLAISFLKEVYEVPNAKIFFIEHGVPDFEAIKLKAANTLPKWHHKKVMFTFGLIGRSKGIEVAIKALPEIVKVHPDFLYVVMGKTHPNIVRYEGEEYRESLKQLAKQLHVSKHIQFIDEYTTEEKLALYLLAADIYVTPYHNKAQITSGTLCYALGGGCAVFSTPFWHAEEILNNGRGKLFGFGNHTELSAQVIEILNHPKELHAMQQKAYTYGRSIAWPLLGKAYISIFERLSMLSEHKIIHLENQYQLIDHPYNPQHLIRMTDSTGILQHAHGCTPNYKTGYCLDDNARALMLAMMMYQQFKIPEYINLVITYLAFTNHMQRKDGSFDNFMTYNREIFETENSEDAFGRSIWALGYTIRFAPNDNIFQLAFDLFQKSFNEINNMRHARGWANCILGLYHYAKRFPDQDRYIKKLSELANQLCNDFDKYSKPTWQWFETSMTYDNGLLPACLFKAYELTGNTRYLAVAEASTQFLESKCFQNNHLTLIGNKKWMRMDEDYELFAQQPIDAMAMVVLYNSMYRIRKENSVAEKLRDSFKWFLGYNDLELPLYDAATCGCNDGIEISSINRNQGAESTIAYHISWLIAAPYFVEQKPATEAILSVQNFVYS